MHTRQLWLRLALGFLLLAVTLFGIVLATMVPSFASCSTTDGRNRYSTDRREGPVRLATKWKRRASYRS